jgi:hypothetical protein
MIWNILILLAGIYLFLTGIFGKNFLRSLVALILGVALLLLSAINFGLVH